MAAKVKQHTIFLQVNGSGSISYPLLTSGGQTLASLYLAPNLAVRSGLTPKKEVPSYLIRVWPGGQGHHVVYTGLLNGSQNEFRRLPAHPDVW